MWKLIALILLFFLHLKQVRVHVSMYLLLKDVIIAIKPVSGVDGIRYRIAVITKPNLSPFPPFLYNEDGIPASPRLRNRILSKSNRLFHLVTEF